MKATFKNLALSAAMLLTAVSSHADLVSIPAYSATYPTPNSACATFGNVVSCSTAVMDYLASQNTPGFTGSYGFAASQGALLGTLVVASNNGNILNNGDFAGPTEDAFTTSNGGQVKYFITGNNNDPTNNGTLANDTSHSWDIGIGDLINKLTFDNLYHQLMFAFDFNNPQNSTASLPIWTMVTLRDTQGVKADISFETQALDTSGGAATIFKDPTAYQTTKTFSATTMNTPGAGDFAVTVGSICVVSSTISYPSPDGSTCPNGGQLVNTNRASNAVEFINYFPGMDLQSALSNGYDTMSIQVWMGCFNNGVRGSGPALANGGSIGPCDTGGFGDIFMLAGAAQPVTDVPEPGTVMLLGLAMGALAWSVRRRSALQAKAINTGN
jgi:hypothetical protein